VSRVVITSGQERFALAACRSLADAGYAVTAVADQTPAATFWSRHCDAHHVLPDAKQDADAFVAGLARIVRETEHAALLPGHEAALLAVSRRRDQLEPHVQLGLPPHDVVEAATDKIALHEAAEVAGLAAPATVVCRHPDEGLSAARELGLPLIVKPQRTASDRGPHVRQRASTIVHDERELAAVTEDFGVPFLLQRRLAGDVYSAAGVMTEDGLRSFSLARYLRTWPPEAGNGAYAVTIPVIEDLRERVAALLRALRWTGIFELELLRSTDGFHAIDLNPRVYGSLSLASRAGAPHAVVFVDWFLGRDPEPRTARPGVRYRWEDADLRHLLWSLRAGRVRDATRTARPHHDTAHAHWRRDDPGPLLARGLFLARQRTGR
jgi:predicted ATP-grasp superfamily ATP-dependent carboligase